MLQSGLNGIVVVALVSALPLSAMAQQPPPANALAQAASIPLPPGPFTSWSPESREPAIRGLRTRCMFIGVMAFANYHGPHDAGSQDMLAFISACVAKQMPEDWPGLEAERDQVNSHYEAAK